MVTDGRVKFYKDLEGNVHKSMLTGFNVETEEQWVAMRDLSTGNIWFMPFVNLKRKRLVKGVPIFVYEELFNYVEEPYYDKLKEKRSTANESAYPGFTNDARLGQDKKFDARYNRQEVKYTR